MSSNTTEKICSRCKQIKNDVSNLQATCPPRNQSKGAKDPVQFMQSRGFLL